MSHSKGHHVGQSLAKFLPQEIVPIRGFEKWYAPLKRRVRALALKLHEEVGDALENAREDLLRREGLRRDVWYITGSDGASLMKSISSIRSRLFREFEKKLPRKRLSLSEVEEIVLSLWDLGRFRVVCNLSLDVEEARKVLVPEPGALLLGRYPVEVEDHTYDLSLRRPAKGHRAWHLKVEVEGGNGQNVFVEVQLMTFLQNAWDRRNHPIYEWHREGGSLPARLLINDVALAETLHLVDEQASRNWQEFLDSRE
jgi:ppGpp synthetase/RelA/SpoT-type nucleotidyltranferase